MTLSRRNFMVGCSAAIAAMAGGRIGNLVFTEQAAAAGLPGTNDILVVVFLRGGMDGLSLVVPRGDDIYSSARRGMLVTGMLDINVNNPELGLGNGTNYFGLHPAASPLLPLYTGGDLAIIQAAGLDNDTRSHFDAMDYIERGTPGNKNTSSGWITRHLHCVDNDDSATLPALSSGAAVPSSLLAFTEAVAMNDPRSYDLSGPWRYTDNSDPRYNNAMLKTVEAMYTGADLVGLTGQRTISAIRQLNSVGAYTPRAGVSYPNTDFSRSLQTIAQMIKLNLGLSIATVDLGGWDHHENQGVNGTGRFANLVGQLANALAAFYDDLLDQRNRLTVVVLSEFGRRLGVNASSGTDHGHGNTMLVLGGNVNGNKMFGRWPGLADLDQDQDLKITTDFRSILGEIVVKRLGNPRLGYVFPGLSQSSYTPLGLVNPTPDAPTTIDFSAPQNRVLLPLIRK